MAHARYYSPRLDRELISRLYHQAQAERLPMLRPETTRLKWSCSRAQQRNRFVLAGEGNCVPHRGCRRTSSTSKLSCPPACAAMITTLPAWRIVSRHEKPCAEGSQPAALACSSVQS